MVIFVVHKNGYFIDVNPDASYLTGYSRNKLLPMHIFNLFSFES
ncbi:PAS domain S-box protein [Methanohalobium sp.]